MDRKYWNSTEMLTAVILLGNKIMGDFQVFINI